MLFLARPVFFLFLLLFLPLVCKSTHLVGGYISVEQKSFLQFDITINLLNDIGSSVVSSGGTLHTGDGQTFLISDTTSLNRKVIQLNNDISIHQIVFQYTYSGPGNYRIWFQELNRNAGIINYYNSVDTPFTIYADIRIDPIFGQLTTSKIEQIPGIQVSIEEPLLWSAAFDHVNDDSISFHKAFPIGANDGPVADYLFPNQIGVGTEYSVNHFTGEIAWDKPSHLGKYGVAVLIKRWRKVGDQYFQIASSMLDIQLSVIDRPNVLKFKSDDSLCLDNSTSIEVDIELEQEGAYLYVYHDFILPIIFNNIPLNTGDTLFLSQSGTYSVEIENSVFMVEGIQKINFQLVEQGQDNHISRSVVVYENCDQKIPIVTNIDDHHGKFFLYPNPTSDLLYVDISNLREEPLSIQIVNMEGKEFYFDRFYSRGKPLQLQTTGLPRGIYLVRLLYQNKLVSQSFVLK